MDVKGIVRNILPFGIAGSRDKLEVKRREKTESTANETGDKEGNGQAQSEGHDQRRNLSEAEIQEAIQILEALPGVKENGLTVKLTKSDGVPAVYIEDRNGKVVRRIPETELSQVLKTKEKKTGHLLNRAM